MTHTFSDLTQLFDAEPNQHLRFAGMPERAEYTELLEPDHSDICACLLRYPIISETAKITDYSYQATITLPDGQMSVDCEGSNITLSVNIRPSGDRYTKFTRVKEFHNFDILDLVMLQPEMTVEKWSDYESGFDIEHTLLFGMRAMTATSFTIPYLRSLLISSTENIARLKLSSLEAGVAEPTDRYRIFYPMLSEEIKAQTLKNSLTADRVSQGVESGAHVFYNYFIDLVRSRRNISSRKCIRL